MAVPPEERLGLCRACVPGAKEVRARGSRCLEVVTHRLGRRGRLLAVVAFSALVGITCAALNSGLFPPKHGASGLQIAAATTHVMVDQPEPSPSIAVRRALPQHLQTLIKHAELLGRVVVSPPVLERIADRCHVPRASISGLARTTANVPLALTEPDSERRASEIQDSNARYRVEVQGKQTAPILDIYTQAPSVAEAGCLADAAITGLTAYLLDLAGRQGADAAGLPRLRQIGAPRGAVVNAGVPLEIAMVTFLVAFSLSCVALAGAIALRKRRHAAPAPERQALPAVRDDAPDSDWPHTTRLLPWLLAGFIALLWLTPFNSIQLNASLPIELRLDRLVLPLVAAAWVVALAAGGHVAPRLRWTWIHLALVALLTCAFLSVVLDARYLTQTLEFDLSMKKLPLIVSYVSLFVITASAVRRSEVRAFLRYTLVLAVLCALGMIYEYRFKQNLFWDWSDKLLPGIFTVGGQLDAGAVDHLGRRLVRGPAEAPLEAVAMLTMALPIALVGLIHSGRWRERILYSVAACALVAATFATYRKSALIAPVSVVLTLAYFRRRELLKLAPLGLVLLIVVSTLSPGAIGSTVRQFTRKDRTAVPTVSDRASDYDAIRPDVWSHLAFGRGWGSYNHESYRILDSEILHRTIESGVLGLVAFLSIGLTVVACTRKTIAARDPTSAPVALIGASIAVGFLVLATLFDELSFPHAPYIFLYMVGLVAVVVEPRGTRKRRTAAADDALAALDHQDQAPVFGVEEALALRR